MADPIAMRAAVRDEVNKRLSKVISDRERLQTMAYAMEDEGYVSTGLKSVDIRLGGGWPRGHVSVVWGKLKSGKSTLVLQTAASNLENPTALVGIWDVERALTRYMSQLNKVDMNQVLLGKPSSMESMLWTMTEFFKVGRSMTTGPVIGILDSYSFIPASASMKRMTKDEGGDGEVKAPLVSAEANAFTRMIPHLIPVLDDNQGVMIIITQARQSFEMSKTGGMGKVYRPAGPEALFHAAQAIVHMKPPYEHIEKKKRITTLRLKTEKNKCGLPLQEMEIDVSSAGVNESSALVDVLVEREVVEKAGAWFVVPGSETLKWHGKENLCAWIIESPENHQTFQNLLAASGIEFSPKNLGVVQAEEEVAP
jgi:recombination protein RecA